MFEYELNNPMALYGSIPYMLAHNEHDGTVGVYLNNPAEMWIDISNSVTDKGVMSKVSPLRRQRVMAKEKRSILGSGKPRELISLS